MDAAPFPVGAELWKSKLESCFISKISQNLSTKIYIGPEQHEHPRVSVGKGELGETLSESCCQQVWQEHSSIQTCPNYTNLLSQLPLSSAWLESGRVLSPPSRAEPGTSGQSCVTSHKSGPKLLPPLGCSRNTHKQSFCKQISTGVEGSSRPEVKSGKGR